MEKKRKAAAEIFAKQYAPQQQTLLDEMSDEEESQGMARKRATPGATSILPQAPLPTGRPKTSEELQIEKEPIKIRETGFWIWKRVIVPPNAYVIHTRTGHTDPVTLGLGVSFRYNPLTDAYLIVPAAMQTIGVVANCITKEKQGINILAYVQWQINDFSVAYRKLDFSDPRDPLGIVNAQLGEQAEAAIKDKISTMSVEEVLTDKAPVIEELTTRLKAVAERRKQGEDTDEGLGIKIITVQIREALVSSQTLWQHLQAPFRHQQEKTARISQLTMQSDIRKKELETHQTDETREAETAVEIERIKQRKATEAAELKASEELTRFNKDQETVQEKTRLKEQTTSVEQESQQRLQIQAAQIEQERELHALRGEQKKTLERVTLEAEANKHQKTLQIEDGLHALAEEERLNAMKIQSEQQQLERETTLKKMEVESKQLLQEKKDELQAQIQEADLTRQRKERSVQLELEHKTNQVKLALQEKELELARLHQENRNLTNERDLMRQLIENLPELAAQMPEIHELKVLQTDGSDAAFNTVATFLTKTLALAENLGISRPTAPKTPSEQQTKDTSEN